MSNATNLLVKLSTYEIIKCDIMRLYSYSFEQVTIYYKEKNIPAKNTCSECFILFTSLIDFKIVYMLLFNKFNTQQMHRT